jgi:hypothetical protein
MGRRKTVEAKPKSGIPLLAGIKELDSNITFKLTAEYWSVEGTAPKASPKKKTMAFNSDLVTTLFEFMQKDKGAISLLETSKYLENVRNYPYANFLVSLETYHG